ncbi:MAG TPA: hypothetical protein VHB21_07435, partial [Minicystis sp.]|nr:hypothetical protein [Minicystis sp.]
MNGAAYLATAAASLGVAVEARPPRAGGAAWPHARVQRGEAVFALTAWSDRNGRLQSFTIALEPGSGPHDPAARLAPSFRDHAARPPVDRYAIELDVADAGHRRGERWGLDRVWKSGDDAFDARVRVDASAPDAVLAEVLRDPEARAAVRALVDVGASVTVTGPELVARLRAGRLPPAEQFAQHFEPIARELERLRASL